MTKIQKYLLLGILIQALLAMLGSLYYSNFGDIVLNFSTFDFFPRPDYGFYPCQLCWCARILMYPIVPISLVGLIRNDKNVIYYILPLATLGIPLEIYHYVLQKLPIETIFDCTMSNPCDAFYVNYLGFITIPFLCLVAFVVIFSLSFAFWRRK